MKTYSTGKSNEKEQKLVRTSLRSNATQAECLLWKALKNKQVGGLKFRRQHGIGPYVMDFYCPELKLCIELDGGIHAESDVHLRDHLRTKYLEDNGIHVLRFSNIHVYEHLDYILERILEFKVRHV